MLAVNPDDAYDVIALNAASASTMISGLPFEGPVSGVRLALIDGQWVAFQRVGASVGAPCSRSWSLAA